MGAKLVIQPSISAGTPIPNQIHVEGIPLHVNDNNLQEFFSSYGKVVYLDTSFKKSPSLHVCDHSDRSTRRATFPFGSANYICFKDHLKHKQ